MRRWDMARNLGGFCIDVTFPGQATEILSHILLRLRLALSPRSSLGESSTPGFALRSE